jgi:hypothetical protein
MDAFDHILHWKLTHGSHLFPGKDGGTCINEAAIVAAGFEYQAVLGVEDMPECFSRPICRLAMGLNDTANDVERQQLIRFVTRLACADTPEVERERAAYIHSRTGRHYAFLEGLQNAFLEGLQNTFLKVYRSSKSERLATTHSWKVYRSSKARWLSDVRLRLPRRRR